MRETLIEICRELYWIQSNHDEMLFSLKESNDRDFSDDKPKLRAMKILFDECMGAHLKFSHERFGEDEVKPRFSYFVSHVIVMKCKGGHFLSFDDYQIFKLLFNGGIKASDFAKEKDGISVELRLKTMRNAAYYTRRNIWCIYGKIKGARTAGLKLTQNKPAWLGYAHWEKKT